VVISRKEGWYPYAMEMIDCYDWLDLDNETAYAGYRGRSSNAMICLDWRAAEIISGLRLLGYVS